LLKYISSIKSSTYICPDCGSKRTINIDEQIHFNRRDLKNKGLAAYIDIHKNYNDLESQEHGVRVYVDHNFNVRSNDLIKVNALKTDKISFELPTPKLLIKNYTYELEFNSWNSIVIESKIHNLQVNFINSLEHIKDKKTKVLTIESPFGTTKITVNFLPTEIGEESIVYLIMWLKELAKWIELTSKMQSAFLLSLFKIIDINNIRPPTITDELIISILLDSYASIRLIEAPNEQILLYKTVEVFDYDENVFKTTVGIDFNTLRIITELLRDGESKTIEELYNHLIDSSDNLTDDNVAVKAETLAQIIIDLIRLDSIDYKVSYIQ
jgi:hypothetical protein